jgi:hypothetical protein
LERKKRIRLTPHKGRRKERQGPEMAKIKGARFTANEKKKAERHFLGGLWKKLRQ